MPFIITGYVRELESGVGVPNLRIEAWDKDLIFDDKLGECLTDTEGRFKISYTEEDFRDLFEKRSDIYLKVFAPNGIQLHSTERHVRCESGKEEHFDIDLPRQLLGEFSPKPPKPKPPKKESTMAIELWIDDGNPWYLSPDIWVVPGNDPNGPIGMPVVGSSAYVYARVHNRGTTAVSNATVKYYWANPSMAITPANATPIGTSYVSLIPGETKEVLCVTPWVPIWVNDGHECLIAEAFSAADPLPPRGPNDPFDPPNDRHVAQRNIGVALAARKTLMAIYPFAAGNAVRWHTEEIILKVKQAPIQLLAKLKESLGLKNLPEDIGEIKEFGLQPFRCGEQVDGIGSPTLRLRLTPGEQQPLALVVKIPRQCHASTGALFLVEQLVRETVVGGIGVLVRPEAEDKEQHK